VPDDTYIGYVLDPGRRTILMEDIWPSLFFGVERVPAVVKKLEHSRWATQMMLRMRREADALIRSPPNLPEGRPGWRHDYYSPKSAEHLVYDPDSGSIIDPWDGSAVEGDAQRSAWILLTHERSYRLMRSVGLLYQLTGNPEYSDWVAKGLKRATRFFERTPRYEPRHGALYFSPLYDAQVILLLANAYDLTRDSPCYEPDDREEILHRIFEEGSRSLVSFHETAITHNITSYVSAGLGAVGSVLGRPELIDLSLSEDPRGLRGLLQNGLRRSRSGRTDGFWYEGTTFYHFYSMPPLFYLYDLSKRTSMSARERAWVRRNLARMARASVALADQNLRLPWFGDLGSQRMPGLPAFEHLYEYCASELDPSFSRVISSCLAQGAKRGLPALVFGPSHLREPLRIDGTDVLRRAGLALLRGEDSGRPFFVAFKSGRHGGGHDHYDKLGIVIHAAGEVISPDIGTAGYSLRDFKEYCVSTLAHNTVMVDERNQGRVGSAGLRFHGSSKALGWVGDGYPGVMARRRVALEPPTISLEDRVECDSEHSLAWVFHAVGEVEVEEFGSRCEALLPPLPDSGPFAFLQDRKTSAADNFLRARWSVSGDISLELLARWDGRYECTVGSTPNNPMTSRLGTLIIRTWGKRLAIDSELRVDVG